MSPKVPAILVLRSAALGDFIIACPALRLLRKHFPGRKIVLLTTQSFSKEQRRKVAGYAGDNTSMPWLELAMPHLIDDAVIMDGELSLGSIMALRQKSNGYAFEYAVLMIDPATPLSSRLKKWVFLFAVTGRAPKIGWRGGAYFSWTRERRYRMARLPHHVTGAMQCLFDLGLENPAEVRDIAYDLRPGPAAEEWASRWIAANASPGSTLVAVAPGSIQPHKRWPLEYFMAVCRTLLELQRRRVHLIVIGTPADVPLGTTIVALAPERVSNLAGKATIPQVAAVLARCQLVFGNDGGAMHLADAMGVKVVSIVPGIEHQDSIEPWHNKQLAVRHPVDCAPCYSFTRCPRGDNRCIAELPVSRVLDKCIQVLDSTPESGYVAASAEHQRNH